MLKKGIDNLLFLSHEFLAFFEAAGFTLNVDNGTVVKGAVENSGGDGDVRKDLVLLGECFVRGEDGRGLFIASGNELKEKIGSLDIHGKVADLINDEHPVLGENL